MIRGFHLADLITLLNGFLGAGAVLAFMRFTVDRDDWFFWLGTALLPVALIMDALDGRVARRRGLLHRSGRSSIRWPTSCRSACAGRHGVRGGHARRLGRPLPGVFRRLRDQPAGTLQRHRLRALRADRQGEVFRGLRSQRAFSWSRSSPSSQASAAGRIDFPSALSRSRGSSFTR